MLENSILGKLYIYWQYSTTYRLLAAIYRFFSNAFKYSGFNALMHKGAKWQELYENSFLGRLVDSVCGFVIKAIRKVAKPFNAAWVNSTAIGLCRGSVFLKYDFMFKLALAAMFLIPHTYWNNIFALIMATGLFIVWIFLVAAGKRQYVNYSSFGAAFFIFVAINVISLLYTMDLSDSVRTLAFFITAFLLMWLCTSYIDGKERLWAIVTLVYVVLMLMSLFAVFQRLTGITASSVYYDQTLFEDMPGRAYSTVENPNNFAEIIVLFAPLCAVFAANIKNMFWRLAASCSLALPALAILLTYSRAGWLSIALTVLVYVYFTNKKLIPWIFVIAILAIPFLPESIMTRLVNLFNTDDTSAGYRIQLWHYTIVMLKEGNRWLTGVGLGSSSYVKNICLYGSEWIRRGAVHSQMLYMELIAEQGIIGAISFACFFVRHIKDACIQIYSSSNKLAKEVLIACVSSFAGLLILSVFEYIWFYPRVLFAYFIVFGIMVAATRLAKEEQ